MKIGIITLPLRLNYGGILQAFALQTILNRMGHEVVVIDKPYTLRLPLYKWPLSYPKRILRKYIWNENIHLFREQYHNRTYPIISQYIRPFIEKYVNRMEINNLSTLRKYHFDAFVVGSDQIWRPLYNLKIENSFLDFTKAWDVRRISYAASFGTHEWEYTEKQAKHCLELIQRFNAISVREDSGVKLCNEYFNVKAVHVLDPTMLLTAKEYIDLLKIDQAPKSKGDLLVYILDETKDKQTFINRISKEKNMIPFHVNAKVEEMETVSKESAQPPVEHWIRGFYDAEFVITDSFHACVFSILFNKPFAVIGNKTRGITRIKSLLKSFGLESCLVDDIERENRCIHDFSQQVLQCLDNYKKQSLSFLLTNLQ